MTEHKNRPDIRQLIAAILFLLAFPGSLFAEVTLDGTLGRCGALDGPNYTINADMGKLAGSNLFHSFGKFGLTSAESATFTGPNTVANIIARVTGGNPSNIDGLIRSDISGANLFFTNPAGIVFGPHAAIDVSGSFHAGTADYIKLGIDGRFDATTPEATVLSVSPPSAFGFVKDNPADITFNSAYLVVPSGKNFSFASGNIYLESGSAIAALVAGSVLRQPIRREKFLLIFQDLIQAQSPVWEQSA